MRGHSRRCSFVEGVVADLRTAVHVHLPAGLPTDFLADGLIAGVGAVIVFLPQILLLFALLYLLEDIGYMARAAFVIDRVMGRVGLEGRAFVSLLSSYACAVPGIMATRTIPSPRHRLVTILVAPLMTCSARLPVYALLIGAFVPNVHVAGPFGLQGFVLLGLYLVGAISALLVASVLTRTLLREDAMPFHMELPPYRLPTAKLWASQVWRQCVGLSAPRRNDHPVGRDRLVDVDSRSRAPSRRPMRAPKWRLATRSSTALPGGPGGRWSR